MTPLPSWPPRFTAAGAIATITLQRPAHRNRLQNEDLVALTELCARINDDPAIRVVILAAEVLDERPVFCAGFNTAEFESGPGPVSFEDAVQALERLRPVTICALAGSIYGGAADLVLACDLVIGVEGIEMRVPAAQLGLHYHASGLVRFITRLGVSFTKHLLLTADAFDAETMLRVGYVRELVPRAQLTARVEALAMRVAAMSPLALEYVKLSLNEIARGEFDVERVRAREIALKQSDDFAEGRRAFAEKRAAVWRRR